MANSEIQTAVAISFNNTSIIEGSLRDLRDRFDIDLSIPNSADRSKVVSAIAVIGLLDGTNNTPPKPITLKKDGITSIGTPTSVGSNDQVYEDAGGDSFQDSTHYSVKIKVTVQENSVITHYSASFTLGGATVTAYDFFYRADGGDVFNNTNIVNADAIKNGSDIIIDAPIHYAINNDDRTPTHVNFHFDEYNDYDGDEYDTDNTEALASYSSLQEYMSDGRYTLTNNELVNDSTYLATVTAIYSDGYSTSTIIPNLHVIASPIIDSVTAYSLEAGDSTIESVMNVYMVALTIPVRMLPTSEDITFNLSQNDASGNPVIFYSATVPVSTDEQDDGTFLYTILKSDLVKEWTTTAPTKNSDNTYTYDVTAVLEFSTSAGSVTRTSNVVTEVFGDDIKQLASVSIVNAWVAATNVDGSGNRVVDYSGTTAQGYNVAPEFGMVGYFTKTDYFGSGITDGFFKDLDTTNTKFRFMVSINDASYNPIEALYMIQGDASGNHQENVIDLLSLTSSSKKTNVNGVYDNIPGASGVPGTSQPDIYFWIPSSELTRLGAVQGDAIKVSVAIQPPAGQTTRPDATESNQSVLLHKVNTYTMVIGTESEPEFTGSGVNGNLTIPMDNETTSEGDLYFIQSFIQYVDASGNNVTDVEDAPDNNEDGVVEGTYDHVIENPSNRGPSDAFTYQVAYVIEDPNGGTITGPLSEEYTIYLKDEPTAANFTVSNYDYNVFNDNSESRKSSFTFDISFNDVGTTSIDGVMVYFQYGEEEEVLVAKVERSDGDSQSNFTVTLTNVSADSSSSSDGINVKDIDGNAVSSYLWPNFTDANIVFKPYYTPKVDSSDDEPVVINDPDTYNIMNVPVIDLPANVSLTGGVIESYDATVMAWTNDLDKYNGLSSIEASFYLEENTQDVTSSISNDDSFTIDLGNTPSTYTMDLSVKVASTVDSSRVYYSKSVVLVFDSVSVDMSGMTVTTRRGSNDVSLKAEYVNYTSNPENASNLNVTAVQLVDNPDENSDPQDEGVKVLVCTSTEDSVQLDGTINTYSIAYDYDLADELNLTMRIEAGVDYTLKYGDEDDSNEESTPLYLTLNGPVTSYIVAKKPEIILGGYSVVPSGDRAGQTEVSLNINANGLKVEGLLSVVLVLVRENDFTTETDESDSTELVLSFESTNLRVKSYVTGADADTTTNSTDNLGAGETHDLYVNEVDGFNAGTDNVFTLVTGSLDNNDNSKLYLPVDSEFVKNGSFQMVAIVSTRVGTDVHVSTVAMVTE